MTTKTRKKTIKLDIACGQNKQKGYKGVDIAPESDADIRHDLNRYPWPFEDNSVSEAFCSHYVEHVPREALVLLPSNGNGTEIADHRITKDGLIAFMEEVHRILKPRGTITITYPHLRSDRAFQDPTHTRFIPEATWSYFAKDWREVQNLDHYPITCDFGIENMYYTGFQGDWGSRSVQSQQFALAHYWNVAGDVVVVMKKR